MPLLTWKTMLLHKSFKKRQYPAAWLCLLLSAPGLCLWREDPDPAPGSSLASQGLLNALCFFFFWVVKTLKVQENRFCCEPCCCLSWLVLSSMYSLSFPWTCDVYQWVLGTLSLCTDLFLPFHPWTWLWGTDRSSFLCLCEGSVSVLYRWWLESICLFSQFFFAALVHLCICRTDLVELVKARSRDSVICRFLSVASVCAVWYPICHFQCTFPGTFIARNWLTWAKNLPIICGLHSICTSKFQ